MEHRFTLKGHWRGGLQGDGEIASGHLASAVSIPVILNGPGKGTNPEELLLGAASTCYLITLGAILERRKVSFSSLDLTSELVMNDEPGHRCKSIVHKPRIVLPPGSTEEHVKTTRDAAERAEKACMISNAIRGNVELGVQAEITVG